MESDIISPTLQRRKLSLRDIKCIAQVHTVTSASASTELQDPLTGLHMIYPRLEKAGLEKWAASETSCQLASKVRQRVLDHMSH